VIYIAGKNEIKNSECASVFLRTVPLALQTCQCIASLFAFLEIHIFMRTNFKNEAFQMKSDEHIYI